VQPSPRPGNAPLTCGDAAHARPTGVQPGPISIHPIFINGISFNLLYFPRFELLHYLSERLI
jgi:hypothetical protein